MAKINFYLLFNGNCEEAFNFYKSAFGVDFTFIGRYGDIPPQNGMPPISEDEKNKIENICLPIAEETVLMGADVCGYMAQNTVFGNNFSHFNQCCLLVEIRITFEEFPHMLQADIDHILHTDIPCKSSIFKTIDAILTHRSSVFICCKIFCLYKWHTTTLTIHFFHGKTIILLIYHYIITLYSCGHLSANSHQTYQ